MKIEKIIKEKICKYDLTWKKLVIAVSGGPDSMTLLRLLSTELPHENLCVAHFNHGWRAEADKEELLVAKEASNYRLKFFSEKSKLKTKSEAEARKARYQFLKKIKEKTKSDYIVLAHHADDQLESIILKLIRGTNPIDLWGMEEQSDSLLRPLLELPKEEIINYCKKYKVLFLTDKSNLDLRYARNRIRQNVLPELKKINPNLTKTVNAQKKLYDELKEYIEKSIFWAKSQCYKNHKIHLTMFRRFPQYIRKALVHNILKENLPEKELRQVNIQSVLDVFEKPGNKRTQIANLLVEREYDWVNFSRPSALELKKPNKTQLTLNKSIRFADFQITLKKGLAKPAKNTVLLPKELTYNLYVRCWKNGDKVVTMSGSKKLQDVFSDAKISKSKRLTWPIILSGKTIVWVPYLAVHKNCLKKAQPESWYIEVKNAKTKQ